MKRITVLILAFSISNADSGAADSLVEKALG